MKSREEEYKEIFIAEALEEFDSINRHITELEKKPDDELLLNEIFRLLHNLKANAKASGYIHISDLAHKMESVFEALRQKQLNFSGNVAAVLFESVDTLGQQLRHIDDPSSTDTRLLDNLDSILNHLSGDQLDESTIRLIPALSSGSENITLSDLIYIPIRKLDDLMNLVGELIIDRDRVLSISRETDNDALKSLSAHLWRITDEIQQSVMDARLVNIGYLFNKFPRIIRDIALAENKLVEVDITGQDIRIDRNILQLLTDSLLHIVRNSISHGIESPESRREVGKDETGLLSISAQNDKETVIIQVEDDGNGVNIELIRKKAVELRFLSAEKAESLNPDELLSLLFEPGFSLSNKVTEFAGRGVGLDVVKNAIESLGGRIQVESRQGEGTTFRLFVPTSIAVKGALLFKTGGSTYAIPLIHTEMVVQLSSWQIHHVSSSLLADVKGETIPLLDTAVLFANHAKKEIRIQDAKNEKDLLDVVVVSYNNRKLGLIVSQLLRQQDIVIKPLQKPLENAELFGGLTLLGSGEVCLVLDIPSILRNYRIKEHSEPQGLPHEELASMSTLEK